MKVIHLGELKQKHGTIQIVLQYIIYCVSVIMCIIKYYGCAAANPGLEDKKDCLNVTPCLQ